MNPKDQTPEPTQSVDKPAEVDEVAAEAAERGREAVRAIRDLNAWQEQQRALVWAKAQREGIDPDDVVLTRNDYYYDD